MENWILLVLILVSMLLVIVLLLGVHIKAQVDIIVRAIPLGTPRVVERRPAPTPQHRND